MNESRWEASRRSARKSGIAIFLVFIAVSVIGGILFINNRDLIGRTPPGESAVITKDTALIAAAILESADGGAADTVDDAHAVEERPLAPPSPTDTSRPDTVPKLPTVAIAPKLPAPAPTPATDRQQPAARAPQPSIQPAAKDDVPSPAVSRSRASIKLPPFACRVDRRKDVVIYLSLELFFEDAEKRSSLLLRRDDIKVMAMKVLRGKELGEITTGKLEEELRGEINKLFDHGEIVVIKISDIRIEKAVKE